MWPWALLLTAHSRYINRPLNAFRDDPVKMGSRQDDLRIRGSKWLGFFSLLQAFWKSLGRPG